MSKSILDVAVSCFASVHQPDDPLTVNLLTWLSSKKYVKEIEQIRRISDKKERDRLKKVLPAITPSGIFKRRQADALIQHSGLIQFDIDFQDNRHIGNYERLKTEIAKIKNVAYCGLSASGRGYWGLIPLKNPGLHRQYFEPIKLDFLRFGIRIDPIVKSVASARGYSYDANAYFNHHAVPYVKILPLTKKVTKPFSTLLTKEENAIRIESLLREIETKKMDITSSYDDWFAIGCALANTFGELGRTYFHRFSQFHLKNDQRETDRQYNHCLRGGYNYSLGSVFAIARTCSIAV